MSQQNTSQPNASRPIYVFSNDGSTPFQYIEPEELQRIHQLREIAQRRAHEEQFRQQYAERLRRQRERDMLAAAELRRQQQLYQREVERLRELKRLSQQQQQQQSSQIPPWAVFSPYGAPMYHPQSVSPFLGLPPSGAYLPYDYLHPSSASTVGPHPHAHRSLSPQPSPYTHSAHDREEAKEAEENQSRELDDQLAEFLLPFFFTNKLGGQAQPEGRRAGASSSKKGRVQRRKQAARKSRNESKDTLSEGVTDSDWVSGEEQMQAESHKEPQVTVEDVTSQVDTASHGEPEIIEAPSDAGRKEILTQSTEQDPAIVEAQNSAAQKIQSAWRSARPHLSYRLKCRTLDAIAAEVDKLAFLNERRALSAPLVFVNADESGALVTQAKENKPFMQHEEALTKILLKLDNITSDGDPQVRDKRRTVISTVQRHLDALDAHKRRQRELRVLEGPAKTPQPSPVPEVATTPAPTAPPASSTDMEIDTPTPAKTEEVPPTSSANATVESATPATVMAKVKYNNVLRQFALSDTTWADFLARVRKVHSIPEGCEITVTHTDEDGDVIAIDSDEELVDLVGFARRCGVRVIRFDIAL